MDWANTPFALPIDAIEFLKSGEQFRYDAADCEPGEVKLKRFEQLTLGEVWIDTDSQDDPHFGETGYYTVPAISLTGECKAYDPEFILLWLPRQRLFGTWDCDHWHLDTFPCAKWADIVANPATFLNAQWAADPAVSERFIPWPQCTFTLGRPF